jgi:hypothetical protein
MTDFGHYLVKTLANFFSSNQNTCQDLAHNLDERCGTAQRLIACGHPYQTGNVFCHQITISMDIDDDIMDVILNNQPQFVYLWSVSFRLVGAVLGLSGME